MSDTIRMLYGLFKLRIGFAIALCALAGIAVTPGDGPGAASAIVLGLSVLLASASAGAFNQYVERDLDTRMKRTRGRPFACGRLQPGWHWPALIVALLGCAVVAATLATNWVAAVNVFLGAFTYGVVYTVWLKRRTWLNIVIGGLAGSFAVLAGAAAVDPGLAPAPVILALVLFLWTPPHFWALAFAYRQDYREAGVPMLPVVVGGARAARIIAAHTVALVALSVLPVFYGMGPVYLACALLGGALFVRASLALVRDPCTANAMRTFKASLVQLTALLGGAMLDGALALG